MEDDHDAWVASLLKIAENRLETIRQWMHVATMKQRRIELLQRENELLRDENEALLRLCHDWKKKAADAGWH